MLKKLWFSYRNYLSLFVVALLLFSASRLLFALVNPETVTGNVFLLAFAGIRYDIAAIAWIFIPLTLLHTYPTRFLISNAGRKLSFLIFIIPLSLALFTNIVDTGWFAFQKKRSTTDVLSVLSEGDDLSKNIVQYIVDYWLLALVWLLCIVIAWKLAQRILRNNIPIKIPTRVKLLASIFFIALYFVAIRGGFQLKPLSTQAAATISGPESAPLVLNTPYTLIKSVTGDALTRTQFYSEAIVEKLFPIHNTLSTEATTHPNIVIFILESFSKEYIGKQRDGKIFTPFLDSLSTLSMNFTNAYANGKRSIEGLPAILTSIPALMNEPFITSHYNTNRINSLATLLKPLGYSSCFFHGGNNGTMGFDNFTALAGYQKYYGKSEYDGDAKNDDGHWGIYDHAFYEFMIRKLNKQSAPFTAAVFSLSSHHPYPIPSDRLHLYPDGHHPILKSVAYADDALRSFFNIASKQAWFANTIFILTADHTGPALTREGSTRTGVYAIPLLIYSPSLIVPSQVTNVAQQCDILPTALHLANFSGNYGSFGRDLLSNSITPFAVNYTNNNYQLITNHCSVVWDGDTISSCQNFSSQQNEPFENCKPETDLLKAIIQQYHHALISNSITAE